MGPELVHARSTVVTHHDPPVHGATLLHYVAANGVEGHRQMSPRNAVEVATVLLEAGALPDAVAGMYGGLCTTMSLLVSSSPPAEAGARSLSSRCSWITAHPSRPAGPDVAAYLRSRDAAADR